MKSFLLGLSFIVLGVTTGLCQDTLSETTVIPKTKILLAHGPSGLEYNVISVVKQHFVSKGCSVEIIDIESFKSQDFVEYKAILLLNAIKENKLPRYIRKGVRSIENLSQAQQPYLFVSTISGTNWLDRKTKTDGVTGASNMDNARRIAETIINRLQLKIDEESKE